MHARIAKEVFSNLMTLTLYMISILCNLYWTKMINTYFQKGSLGRLYTAAWKLTH